MNRWPAEESAHLPLPRLDTAHANSLRPLRSDGPDVVSALYRQSVGSGKWSRPAVPPCLSARERLCRALNDVSSPRLSLDGATEASPRTHVVSSTSTPLSTRHSLELRRAAAAAGGCGEGSPRVFPCASTDSHSGGNSADTTTSRRSSGNEVEVGADDSLPGHPPFAAVARLGSRSASSDAVVLPALPLTPVVSDGRRAFSERDGGSSLEPSPPASTRYAPARPLGRFRSVLDTPRRSAAESSRHAAEQYENAKREEALFEVLRNDALMEGSARRRHTYDSSTARRRKLENRAAPGGASCTSDDTDIDTAALSALSDPFNPNTSGYVSLSAPLPRTGTLDGSAAGVLSPLTADSSSLSSIADASQFATEK